MSEPAQWMKDAIIEVFTEHHQITGWSMTDVRKYAAIIAKHAPKSEASAKEREKKGIAAREFIRGVIDEMNEPIGGPEPCSACGGSGWAAEASETAVPETLTPSAAAQELQRLCELCAALCEKAKTENPSAHDIDSFYKAARAIPWPILLRERQEREQEREALKEIAEMNGPCGCDGEFCVYCIARRALDGSGGKE